MDIIAQRELARDGRTYQVRISAPHQEAAGEYRCAWELTDDAGGVVLSLAVYGVDSVQALVTAAILIGDRLRAEHDDFTWLGNPGTGFLRHDFGSGDAPVIVWDLA